jgi:hypothetical protein
MENVIQLRKEGEKPSAHEDERYVDFNDEKLVGFTIYVDLCRNLPPKKFNLEKVGFAVYVLSKVTNKRDEKRVTQILGAKIARQLNINPRQVQRLIAFFKREKLILDLRKTQDALERATAANDSVYMKRYKEIIDALLYWRRRSKEKRGWYWVMELDAWLYNLGYAKTFVKERGRRKA